MLTFLSWLLQLLYQLSGDLHSSMRGENETQLVAEVLHFLDLSEAAELVDIRKLLHNLGLVLVVFF